ncbi:hypothetical protein ACFV0R_17785, partial [Streptomyces sp. NPDC059578]|uniref:hypothetical protein n=1 Tax=Streptomyces sp. NPDC059578 TaxID=3346874 RepID=UPI0036A2020B
KEPHHQTVRSSDGVSTYLALTFGTLLSSQGTDASFVLTPAIRLRLSSGRFPSVFPTLSDLSDPISSALSGRTLFGVFLSGDSDFIRGFPVVRTTE